MLKQSLWPFRAALIAVVGRTVCVADPDFLVYRGRNTARGDRSQGDQKAESSVSVLPYLGGAAKRPVLVRGHESP